MISVEEARERILTSLSPSGKQALALSEGWGRVLASDLVARLTQPPADMSAMDGYAVRSDDLADTLPIQLRVVGHAPAGGSYPAEVKSGETVRIFTGGPLPEGADCIVIQENVDAPAGDAVGAIVTISEPVAAGTFVRSAGLDFTAGERLISVGRRLTSRDIGLAAAMNHPWLSVFQRPRIGILATGDEVVMPGDPLQPNQIVSSNSHALAAFIRAHGGEPVNLGIAGDTREALETALAGIGTCDLLVTTGGASVGTHDLVGEVLGGGSDSLDFWRIAMRPCKPLMFGHAGKIPLLGLPGNPVSSLVCATLFLAPALEKLSGTPVVSPRMTHAVLGEALGENDRREDYLRGTVIERPDGALVATAYKRQDSSMLCLLTHANCLIKRAPHAPAAKEGSSVEIIHLEHTGI